MDESSNMSCDLNTCTQTATVTGTGGSAGGVGGRGGNGGSGGDGNGGDSYAYYIGAGATVNVGASVVIQYASTPAAAGGPTGSPGHVGAHN
jgi:hypothetical protein